MICQRCGRHEMEPWNYRGWWCSFVDVSEVIAHEHGCMEHTLRSNGASELHDKIDDIVNEKLMAIDKEEDHE